MANFLKLDEDGGIVTVTIDRPDKRNALSVALRHELREMAARLDGRDDIACVLLTGAGSAFRAGADLSDPHAFGAEVSVAEARRIARAGPDMCAAWERLRALTIAVINGPAIGGAMSLAVSCDFRIMGRDAFFRAPEIDLGLSYTWGSMARIGNLVGPARAKLIGALARTVDAECALSWGLCEEVADDPMAAARAMAAEIASKPRIAQQMIKESMNRRFAVPDTVYLEQDQLLLLSREPDANDLQQERLARLGREEPR